MAQASRPQRPLGGLRVVRAVDSASRRDGPPPPSLRTAAAAQQPCAGTRAGPGPRWPGGKPRAGAPPPGGLALPAGPEGGRGPGSGVQAGPFRVRPGQDQPGGPPGLLAVGVGVGGIKSFLPPTRDGSFQVLPSNQNGGSSGVPRPALRDPRGQEGELPACSCGGAVFPSLPRPQSHFLRVGLRMCSRPACSPPAGCRRGGQRLWSSLVRRGAGKPRRALAAGLCH